MSSARNIPNEPTIVATQLNNLAQLLSEKGDYDGAELLFREAIVIKEKVYGHDHPSTATTLNNIAVLLYSKGKKKEASVLGKQALRICEKALGPNHPTTKQYREDWA